MSDSPPSRPAPRPLPLIRRIRYAAEFLPLFFLIPLLSAFPRSWNLEIGKCLGRAIHALLRSRLKIGRSNVLAAFPDLDEDAADAVIRGCWENLGQGFAEFPHLPKLSDEELLTYMTCDGLEHLRDSQKLGKGAVLATAHYGVWELGAKFWPYAGFKTAVVARRIKNPFVDRYVTQVRSSHGIRVIPAREGVRESIRWLKEGNLLALLADHRIVEGGLKVPLFGRPAYTTTLPAILALRYGIPVHPTRCWREGDKVRIAVEPALDVSGLSANDEGIYQATLKLNQTIERWVREQPQAWLWIHNRWKI